MPERTKHRIEPYLQIIEVSEACYNELAEELDKLQRLVAEPPTEDGTERPPVLDMTRIGVRKKTG